MPHYWLLPACCVCLRVCWVSSKVSDQLSRAEWMHTAINTWPPIPSFIYWAMSEAWPFISFYSTACNTGCRINKIKGTKHHNKLYYQPARWDFIGNLSHCLFTFISLPLLSFCALFYLSPVRTVSVSLSFSVPTDYWWVDFTTQWCGERTVEYAVC